MIGDIQKFWVLPLHLPTVLAQPANRNKPAIIRLHNNGINFASIAEKRQLNRVEGFEYSCFADYRRISATGYARTVGSSKRTDIQALYSLSVGVQMVIRT
jgi:hypothetical protein